MLTHNQKMDLLIRKVIEVLMMDYRQSDIRRVSAGMSREGSDRLVSNYLFKG